MAGTGTVRQRAPVLCSNRAYGTVQSIVYLNSGILTLKFPPLFFGVAAQVVPDRRPPARPDGQRDQELLELAPQQAGG